MDSKRARFILHNMKTLIENMICGGVVRMWATPDTVEALDMAIEALEEKELREDDRR